MSTIIWGRISVVLDASTAKVISPRPNRDVISQRSRALNWSDVFAVVSIAPHAFARRSVVERLSRNIAMYEVLSCEPPQAVKDISQAGIALKPVRKSVDRSLSSDLRTI